MGEIPWGFSYAKNNDHPMKGGRDFAAYLPGSFYLIAFNRAKNVRRYFTISNVC
jgi:hypothetical protein